MISAMYDHLQASNQLCRLPDLYGGPYKSVADAVELQEQGGAMPYRELRGMPHAADHPEARREKSTGLAGPAYPFASQSGTRANDGRSQLPSSLNSEPAAAAVGPRAAAEFETDAQHDRTARSLLGMQRIHGNRAVQRVVQAKLNVSQPDDAHEREADEVAEQIMRMPEPVDDAPSKPLPALASQSADDGGGADALRSAQDADANGVAPHAEDAVAAAANSTGQPLPGRLKRKFETAFGMDLGAVRVHTGSRSVEASQAISAHAYTTGADIHFNQGQYDPDSSEGQRLLAHELTHVVQQSSGMAAGSAARLVQRAAEVIRKPGWGSTPAGDDSNIWFSPHAELWLGAAPTQTMAQATWFPRAASGGREETLTVPASANQGFVSFTIDLGWYKDNMVDDETGAGQILVVAPFRVNAQGTLEWQTARVGGSAGGRGAQLVSPVAATAAGNSLIVTPTLDGMGSFGTSSGASGGVPGAGVSGGTSTSAPAGTREFRTYSVVLEVARANQVVTLQPTYIYSKVIQFAPGQDRIVDENQGSIAMWFMRLPETVRNSVSSGATQIDIEGYASTTRGWEFNQDLSERRARRLQRILQGPASTHADFHVSWFGEAAARVAGQPDEVESPEHRRAVASITYTGEQSESATPAPAP